MELTNVRIKSFPFTLGIFGKYLAHAIYPNIYVPKYIYDDLNSKKPDPRNVSILIHEQTHIKRQREMGWLMWGIKYCLSGKFRFEEELAATRESMKYYKNKGLEWDVDKSAKFLSSYLYLWCVSYDEAKTRLTKTWDSLTA